MTLGKQKKVQHDCVDIPLTEDESGEQNNVRSILYLQHFMLLRT